MKSQGFYQIWIIGTTSRSEVPTVFKFRSLENAQAEERRLTAEAKRINRPVRYEVRPL